MPVRKSLLIRALRLCIAASLVHVTIHAATFGRIVPVVGQAADLALDEGRGVLYIANYSSSRIDVLSLAEGAVTRSINVPPYPNSLSVSPDGRYLVVTHYASSKDVPLSPAGQDALTVIDLKGNTKQTFGLSSGPFGVAFGFDNLALVVTQEAFLLFDPASGVTTVLDTVANVASQTLPVPLATMPLDVVGGALTAAGDGRHILGILGSTPDKGDHSVVVRFSYNVTKHQITANQGLSSSPSLGPRAVSASRDGAYWMTGWALFGCGQSFLDCDATGPLLAQWPKASGALNVGSVAIRSSKSVVYAEIFPASVKSPLPANLLVLDADNLSVRERIQIPEHLAGRSVFTSDEGTLYSISDSGITVFSMAALDKAPRVIASAEDVVFHGNFCSSSVATQQIDVTDPSGNSVPFQICLAGATSCEVPGITITPSSAVTPARVKITVDAAYTRTLLGTKALKFEIRSPQAVNMPAPPSRGVIETDYQTNVRSRFRVLINNRVPENRGAVVNVPGSLVDILADPGRNRFYVLRQDTNQVLVYDSTSFSLQATLRTGNTPTQMAITFDGNSLLVGNDNSQIASRYDLNTLQALPPIVFPIGHYPRSIAASSNGILAASRVAGPVHTIDRVNLLSLTASTPPSLGSFKNDVNVSTTLVAAPNGASILAAMPDGNVMLYSATADSFTISRKEFSALAGSLAASAFGYYTVGRYVLNQSLVSQGPVIAAADTPSGFAYIEADGISTLLNASGAGRIQRMSFSEGPKLPTGLVEAPLTGDTDYPFCRTLAVLGDRSALVQLTTSGFSVIPWDYDAAIAPPVLQRVVSAADLKSPVAPGGLAAVLGSGLSPVTLATKDAPLPTVMADSCLTANGLAIPMQFVSPSRINVQIPFGMGGSVEMVLHTPNGVTDTLHVAVPPAAPAVFRSGTAGPVTEIATVFRASNGEIVTNSNPIHMDDHLTIYLTGMGKTWPQVEDGAAAPFTPLSTTLLPPTATLGGAALPVEFAGLTPGTVGVYQLNVVVPFKGIPTGFEIPLTITQGGSSTTIPVRVVN